MNLAKFTTFNQDGKLSKQLDYEYRGSLFLTRVLVTIMVKFRTFNQYGKLVQASQIRYSILQMRATLNYSLFTHLLDSHR